MRRLAGYQSAATPKTALSTDPCDDAVQADHYLAGLKPHGDGGAAGDVLDASGVVRSYSVIHTRRVTVAVC